MAVIYPKLGNLDKAIEKMSIAIDLAPENLTYRYNLAIMLDKQHKNTRKRPNPMPTGPDYRGVSAAVTIPLRVISRKFRKD